MSTFSGAMTLGGGVGDFVPPQSPEQMNNKGIDFEKKAKEALAELPEKDKEKLNLGFAGLGFVVNKWKNEKFSAIFGKTADTLCSTKNEQGEIVNYKPTGRFLKALASISEREAKIAEKNLNDLRDEKRKGEGVVPSLKTVAGWGSLLGNTTKYGRMVFDVFGGGFAATASTRFGMFVATSTATIGEAGKEARFMNEEREDTSRIKDIDTAFDEAIRIQEMAKNRTDTLNEKGEPTKEALEKAYQETIPLDILRRLKDTNEKPASGLINKFFTWRIEKAVTKIQDQLTKIDASKYLTQEGKELAKRDILYGFLRSPMLRDFDKAVGQAGIVDTSFMLLRTLEQVGKTATYAMMADTLLRTLWNGLPSLISSAEAKELSGSSHPLGLLDNDTEAIPSKQAIIPLATTYEVKSGDTLTIIVRNQLKNAGKLEGLSPQGRLHLVETFINKFEDLGQDGLKAAGITSGNINKIYAGETINLSVLGDQKVVVIAKEIEAVVQDVVSTAPSGVDQEMRNRAMDSLLNYDKLTEEELAASEGFQLPTETTIEVKETPIVIPETKMGATIVAKEEITTPLPPEMASTPISKVEGKLPPLRVDPALLTPTRIISAGGDHFMVEDTKAEDVLPQNIPPLDQPGEQPAVQNFQKDISADKAMPEDVTSGSAQNQNSSSAEVPVDDAPVTDTQTAEPNQEAIPQGEVPSVEVSHGAREIETPLAPSDVVGTVTSPTTDQPQPLILGESSKPSTPDQTGNQVEIEPTKETMNPFNEYSSSETRASLSKLSLAEINTRLSPEEVLIANNKQTELYSLLNYGFFQKGQNTELWKKLADKPVEFLFAQNDTSLREKLFASGKIDAKQLGNPVFFLKEVLKLSENDLTYDTRFSYFQSALKGMYLKDGIIPQDRETVSQYLERASKVYAIVKKR